MHRRTMILAVMSVLSGTLHRSLASRSEDSRHLQPRGVGAVMPEFSVRNADDEVVKFSRERLVASTVFIFYRGGWDEECQWHLPRLKEAHSRLRSMGFDVLFLSADSPRLLRRNAQVADLPYDLLSDSQMQAARAFGVAYHVDDFTFERYDHFGIDLEIISGAAHHQLAFPSVFIVDRTGLIRFSYCNPAEPYIAADVLVAAALRVPHERNSRRQSHTQRPVDVITRREV